MQVSKLHSNNDKEIRSSALIQETLGNWLQNVRECFKIFLVIEQEQLDE